MEELLAILLLVGIVVLGYAWYTLKMKIIRKTNKFVTDQFNKGLDKYQEKRKQEKEDEE